MIILLVVLMVVVMLAMLDISILENKLAEAEERNDKYEEIIDLLSNKD